MPPKAKPLADRLSAHSERSGGPDSCWTWTGGRNAAGYGVLAARVFVKKRPMLAHRISWMVHAGPIPAGLCVLHRCDNPPCINPAHLFLGTHADNVADKMAKGRYRAGAHSPENSSFTKLSREAVREIRRRFAKGETKPRLGAAFGVTRQCVHEIVTNKTWKEPDGLAPAVSE